MGVNARSTWHAVLLPTLGGGIFATGYLLASYTLSAAPTHLAEAGCAEGPMVSALMSTVIAQNQLIAHLEGQATTVRTDAALRMPWPFIDELQAICLALSEPAHGDCGLCAVVGDPVPVPVAEPPKCPSESAYWLTDSPDPVERARALKIVAMTGSLEDRAALIELALDSTDDIILRREIVANMDWSGLGDELAALIADERSSDVRQAAILAAADVGFSAGERTVVDAAMVGLFEKSDQEPALQVEILDYFANSSADPAYSLATLYFLHPSPEILERMNFITEFFDF